jgi:hypothetical protein
VQSLCNGPIDDDGQNHFIRVLALGGDRQPRQNHKQQRDQAAMTIRCDRSLFHRSAIILQRLTGAGYDVMGDNTPEQFSDFVKREIVKWAKVVKDLGLKPN